MQDLKNLNCLLPKTKEVLLQMVESCNFLDKYVLVGGSALTISPILNQKKKYQKSKSEIFFKRDLND